MTKKRLEANVETLDGIPEKDPKPGRLKNPALWKKGQSGNPRGRPKVVFEVRALAREHTTEAINTLVEIMRNSSHDKTRLDAANAILDRGYGKPSQHVEVRAEEMSDDQLFREVYEIIERNKNELSELKH